jgi:hypothetical protein
LADNRDVTGFTVADSLLGVVTDHRLLQGILQWENGYSWEEIRRVELPPEAEQPRVYHGDWLFFGGNHVYDFPHGWDQPPRQILETTSPLVDLTTWSGGVVVRTADGTISLYDGQWNCRLTVSGNVDVPPVVLRWRSASGDTLEILAAVNGDLLIGWDVETGGELWHKSCGEVAEISAAEITGDGIPELVLGGANGLCLVNPAGREIARRFGESVRLLRVAPASAGQRALYFVRDTETGSQLEAWLFRRQWEALPAYPRVFPQAPGNLLFSPWGRSYALTADRFSGTGTVSGPPEGCWLQGAGDASGGRYYQWNAKSCLSIPLLPHRLSCL